MSDKPASPARGRKKTAPPAQQPPQEEVVVRLPLTDLHPFPDHPFQVRDDEEMRETIQSVKEYGVIIPAIVRPREEGGYEIVAGHRRKYACEQAGLDTMPVLIRNLDRDAATIIMVDSNLQRENILPSERAKAYKMKLEAIKRQGARNDLTSPKISAKLRSDDEIGQQMGVSGDTVRNYISLTNLVPELMQMVDDGKIALSPAYQIAALKPEEQQILVTTIDYEQATPSLSQAQRMKKFSQAGRLNEDSMLAIMSEEKKPEKFSLTLDGDRIRKYFPKSYTPLQMENTIIKLLEAWQKKLQRSHWYRKLSKRSRRFRARSPRCRGAMTWKAMILSTCVRMPCGPMVINRCKLHRPAAIMALMFWLKTMGYPMPSSASGTIRPLATMRCRKPMQVPPIMAAACRWS